MVEDREADDIPPYEDKHIEPGLPYEDKPIDLRTILKAIGVLFFVGIVIHVIIWAQFGMLDKFRKEDDPRVSPLRPAQQVPPGPHLEAQKPAMSSSQQEPFEAKSLLVLRTQEANTLDSYAWVDERTGVVRIPIREAMKRVVQLQGQTPESQAAASQPQTSPAQQQQQ